METQTSKLTAKPWRVGDAGHTIFGPPNGNPSPVTVGTGIKTKEEAAFIIKACNNFEQLVASVQNLLEDIDALQSVDDLALSVSRSRSWFSVLRANSLLDDIRTS